jgi:NADH-quinone oxidoreductase subunit A
MALLMAGFGYVIKKGILRWNEAVPSQTFAAKPVLKNQPAEIGQAA